MTARVKFAKVILLGIVALLTISCSFSNYTLSISTSTLPGAASPTVLPPTATLPPVSTSPPPTPGIGTPPGAYVWLAWPRQDNYNLDIDLTISATPQEAIIIFWAHQFGFTGGEGGYLGLQLVGNQKKAIFSIWGANGGADWCNTFIEDGAGWQCLIDYDWQMDRTYRLRLWVLNMVEGGEWWVAAVYDYAADQEVVIGQIRVPPERGWLSSSSVTWVEYAGYNTCEVPYTNALWAQPYARHPEGDGMPTQAEVAYGQSACPLSNVFSAGVDGMYIMEAGQGAIRQTLEGSLLWP